MAKEDCKNLYIPAWIRMLIRVKELSMMNKDVPLVSIYKNNTHGYTTICNIINTFENKGIISSHKKRGRKILNLTEIGDKTIANIMSIGEVIDLKP